MKKQRFVAKPTAFQKAYERVLLAGMLILALGHTALSAYRYLFDYYQFARPVECWYVVVLAALAALYVVTNRTTSPATFHRVKDFFHRLCTPETLLLAGLFVWYVVSCAVNRFARYPDCFRLNDWWLLDMAVCTFVLFPMAGMFRRDNFRKVAEGMMHLLLVGHAAFTLWCLVNVFQLNIVTFASGAQLGMTNRVCLTMGVHYNITGAICVTMFALALYMIATGKPAIQAVYGVVAAIELVALLLTNSRTVYVCALLLAAGTAFFGAWTRMGRQPTARRLGAAVLLAAASAALVALLRRASFAAFESITHFSLLVSESTGKAAAGDSLRELNSLSGRPAIWMGTFRMMFANAHNTIFGVTPVYVTQGLIDYGGLNRSFAHAHNVILQVGASLGLPGLVLFVAFMACIAWKCCRIVFRRGPEIFRGVFTVPLTILMLVVMNMAEAYLVGYFSFMACVFFLFCGWTSTLDCKKIV